MAPKKNGKGDKKGKKKKDDGEGSAEAETKELLKFAGYRIESLERQLIWREEKLQVALAGQKELRERVEQYHRDFEREKEEIFDISSDMTRQYKDMQEELISKVNQLNETIQEQKDQLEAGKEHMDQLRTQKDQELAAKDSEIEQQKVKMEDMAVEFGDMLKETLEKMSERIEITNSSWDGGTGDQVARRLEEFKMSVSSSAM